MNNKLIQSMKLGAVIAVLWTMEAGAALPLKRSENFPNQYEMDNVAQGVDPAAATGQWSLPAGPGTASLSGGLLNLSTTASGTVYWQGTTQAVHSIGSTIEARVRADSSVSIPGFTNRVFQLALGDNTDTGVLTIGLDRVVWNPTDSVIDTGVNAGGLHVFRIAQDANSSVYQVWRDELQIGLNLPGYGFGSFSYFGDGGTGSGGAGAFDYVRLDYTGGFSIPEPTSIVLLLLGAGMLLLQKQR